MSATPSLPSILDPSHPLAYLAYLPPSLAYEFTIAVYVLVAALVVQIWDILNNLNEDYKLLVKRPIGLPGIVYCISRISSFAYLLYAVIYETAPLGHCERVAKIAPWLYCIAMPSTALLFYFRVTAIYNHNKYVSGFFLLLWLCVLASALVSLPAISGTNIGPTKHCLSGATKSFDGMGAIIPLVHDSFVFVAISFRLMQIGTPEEMKIKDVLKAILFAKDMTAFTKALLRDGQAYYLSTVGLYLASLIIFYINSISLVYRTIFSVACIAVINVMACRVYRRTKAGKYRENTTMELTLPISFLRESRAEIDNAAGPVESPIVDICGSAAFAVTKCSIEGFDALPTDPRMSAEKGLSS